MRAVFQEEQLRLYHRTTAANAEHILREGFKDSSGTYLSDRLFSGVWLSLVPFDLNDGAKGDTLLRLDLNCTELELSDFEWVEEGKVRREWLVPAELIRRCVRKIRVVAEDAL
jgi:hypothetical protein